MPTYPSGTVLPAGSMEALEGTDPNLRYTDPTGTFKFRILGGEAPWPGINDGIVCSEWPRNMSPPFKHLDLQAAQQDGVTWTATVYDPPEIILPLEAHGTSARAISKVVSEWISSWDPKNPGLLEYFTFDRGYWFCTPRLSKVWQDQIKQSPRRHLKQKMVHACRIDNAFWSSIPSTSTFDTSSLGDEVQTLTIEGSPTGGSFPVSWNGAGPSSTTIAHNATSLAVQTTLESLSTIGVGNITVTGSSGGPWEVTFVGDLAGSTQPLIQCGTGLTGGFFPSVQVAETFPGGSGTGFVPLTNIGDQDAWPSYLVYGPGVFGFGNGPGSTSMITFGTASDPILEGQVVLITTMPRLRSVVDLTPTALPPQNINVAQNFLEQLVNLISGVSGDLTVGAEDSSPGIPPLLQWFESLFGISPPQGNLYALLSGRFTNPIPGVPQPFMAQTSYIPISVTGGNSSTKIVASVTPLRRWPE
jgi:hypothetical protein